MKSTLKFFLLLTVPISIVACNAQSSPSEPKTSNEETMATAEVSGADNDVNAKPNIVLYMKYHDLSGLEKSTESDANFYRVLIKELPNDSYLVQDFFISGDKLTDPYILTDGKLEYNDNEDEDVAHPNNNYPREGARIVWFESGNKKIESHYKNNMLAGTWIDYYENGQKHNEDYYIDGFLHGTSKSWNEQGDLTLECTYNHGVENGRCYSKFNSYPDIYQSDSNYKNGKKIGISKQWNMDGTINKFTFNGLLSLQEIKKDLPKDQFEIFTFDVNADDIDDLVISRINDDSNLFQGDELYVLTGDKSGKYTLSLSTRSYTTDTGWYLSNILPRRDRLGFIISTQYSTGSSEYTFYYTFENGKWYISDSSNEGSIPTGDEYYCIDHNKSSIDDFITLIASYPTEADELVRNCPPPPTKYTVKTDQAEILDEKFESRSKPNYYIKGDLIEAFDQNEDWVKVAYKNGTKFGWIDKRDLSPIAD
ncbi:MULTISPECIES: hypothetical protein [unclassified Psychrobacter]|uniref:hypothetical protein n=1 Tax=unclassified Psychrobacter TaxID=196806 RepID=UPI0025B37607|nr:MULTISPECIES: hypothetical protein [unclassified Psychrobacter]MDN3453616.1 hypothetical protein [Psychrobacter sp. APC 3350]MDN3501114.1 hypothetical protein [Psychrobacter sp. 5A.1]